MDGKDARESFERADKLRREGKFDEALAVPMYPTDRTLMEQRVERDHSMQNAIVGRTWKHLPI